MLCHCHGTADTYTRHADPETTERSPPNKSLEGNALPLPRNRRTAETLPMKNTLPLLSARTGIDYRYALHGSKTSGSSARL